MGWMKTRFRWQCLYFFFVCETSTPAGRKNELTLNPSKTESFARRPWNTKWGAVGARKAPPKPNPARPPEATATSYAPTVFTENCAIENPETFHNPGGGNWKPSRTCWLNSSWTQNVREKHEDECSVSVFFSPPLTPR